MDGTDVDGSTATIRNVKRLASRWKLNAEDRDVCLRAVADLEKLAADNERLTRERDESRQYGQRYVEMTDPLIACSTEEPFTCGTCRACYIQRAEAAEQEAKELREALNYLRNEIGGTLSLADVELRAVIGNTNFACLTQRVAEADEILARSLTQKNTGGSDER